MSGVIVPFVPKVSPGIATIRGRATHRLLSATDPDERAVLRALQGAHRSDEFFTWNHQRRTPEGWRDYTRSFFLVRNGGLKWLGEVDDETGYEITNLLRHVWAMATMPRLAATKLKARPVTAWSGKRTTSRRKRERYPLELRLARGVCFEVPEPANDWRAER